jgi:pseudouridine synthase
MLIRLQKYLADCGLASRRKAEALILSGQIRINDKIVNKLGTKIDPQKDEIYFQNKLIKPEQFVYIMLNKPIGYTCTTRGFIGEKNILDLVKIKEKIFPIGRLDKESQGLILLTNDGDFAYKLTHPKFEMEKEYLVTLAKSANVKDLNKMREGINDENEILKIKSFKIIAPKTISLILTQGHKREIRRLFKHFHYHIIELKRIRIAKWLLGNLKPGHWQFFQP